MVNEKEIKKQIKKFIEKEIPQTVSNFSLPDGKKYLKKYYLDFFTEDGVQLFNLSNMKSKFDVVIHTKDVYERFLKTGLYKDRYKNYRIEINSIKLDKDLDPMIATVKATMWVNKNDPHYVEYKLEYNKGHNNWRIKSTSENELNENNLAYDGIFREKLIKPMIQNYNIIQRLIRFRDLFLTNDLKKCFWINKNEKRKSIERIAESLTVGYLMGCASWDFILAKPHIGEGIPDWIFCANGNKIGVEIKTDNFSNLTKSLTENELDDDTKKQLNKFYIGNSIDEMFIVYYHDNNKNINEKYCLHFNNNSDVFVLTINYGHKIN